MSNISTPFRKCVSSLPWKVGTKMVWEEVPTASWAFGVRAQGHTHTIARSMFQLAMFCITPWLKQDHTRSGEVFPWWVREWDALPGGRVG